MREQDYFWWKDERGVLQLHHVSEFDGIIFGEGQTPEGKDPGRPIRETGRKDPAKINDPDPVHREEAKIPEVKVMYG